MGPGCGRAGEVVMGSFRKPQTRLPRVYSWQSLAYWGSTEKNVFVAIGGELLLRDVRKRSAGISTRC